MSSSKLYRILTKFANQSILSVSQTEQKIHNYIEHLKSIESSRELLDDRGSEIDISYGDEIEIKPLIKGVAFKGTEQSDNKTGITIKLGVLFDDGSKGRLEIELPEHYNKSRQYFWKKLENKSRREIESAILSYFEPNLKVSFMVLSIYINLRNYEGQVLPGDHVRAPVGATVYKKPYNEKIKLEKNTRFKVMNNNRKGINKYQLNLKDLDTDEEYWVMNYMMDDEKKEDHAIWSMAYQSETKYNRKSKTTDKQKNRG